MYKSIIEQVCSDIHTQYENDVVKVVQSYGFNVDKEELAKALAYDRHQYEKGYEDGKREILEKQNKYRWHDLRKDPNDLPDDGDALFISVSFRGRETWAVCSYEEGEFRDGINPPNLFQDDIKAWKYIDAFEEVEI